jgi:membrane-bound lytic murein transglycosylase D
MALPEPTYIKARDSNLRQHQRPQTQVVDGMKTYQVKSGDSPFKIAHIHQMPLDRFLKINRLSSRSTIFPGQKVYVE